MGRMGLAVCLAGGLVAACGKDDDGGVAAGKQVGELSQSEAKTFCGEVEETFSRLGKVVTQVMCTEQAREDAGTCSSTRRSCIDHPPFDVDIHDKIDFQCQGSDTAITQVCPEVKVGELRACMDGLLDALEATADQFTCTSDPNALKKPTVPDACRGLGTRCPSLSGFSFD